MFKKLLATTTILVSTLSTAYAASVYVGPGAMWQSVSINGNHYQGISPNFSLGYSDWVSPAFYLAAELNAAPWSLDLNNEPKNGLSLKVRSSYTASFLPGYPLDELLMVYLRLGYRYSHFDKLDINKGGFTSGIGLTANLTPCWDIRAEFDYTKYGSIDSVGKPSSNEYFLSGIYRFYSF